jgi:L-threonylcarbamoyladenylate synthase
MRAISNSTNSGIKLAAKALMSGNLVVFPTETVYGLGADATNKEAVGKIYHVKGRPTSHPLIIHISSINLISKWAIEIPEYVFKLATDFWPGPMTLILKRSNLAKDFITSGQDSVGLRIPNQSTALNLLKEFERMGGLGIAAPSANKFGAVSPTTAKAAQEEIGNSLGENDIILKGSKSSIGIESTIVNCISQTPEILRPGKIDIDSIENSIKMRVVSNYQSSKVRSPGMHKAHYSPQATVILDEKVQEGEGFIAMSNVSTPRGVIRLSSPRNDQEFAHNLYEALRAGDRKKLKIIKVIPPEGSGLAESIRDRLLKSSYKQKDLSSG